MNYSISEVFKRINDAMLVNTPIDFQSTFWYSVNNQIGFPEPLSQSREAGKGDEEC